MNKKEKIDKIRLLILLLALTIISPLRAQTISNLTGFQVERIKPNSLNLIGLNTSVTPNASTAKTIYRIFGENATNAYVKKSNDPSEADNIWVIQNDGTWLQIYYAPGGGGFPPERILKDFHSWQRKDHATHYFFVFLATRVPCKSLFSKVFCGFWILCRASLHV